MGLSVAAATLIGAGLTAGTGAANVIATNSLNKKTREWNEKMLRLQNQWSLDQWNRTNAYNDPSQQLARLKSAGLNPLYYGLDGSSAQSFESAQPLGWNPETPDFTKSGNQLASMIANYPLLEKQAEQMEANIQNINADTSLKTNQSLTEIEKRNNLIKERDEIQARIDNLIADKNLKESEKAKIDKFQEYADSIYQVQIDKDNSIKDLNDTEKKRIDELLPGEKDIQELTKQEFIKRWRKWSAEINHMYAQDAVLAKEAKYYLLDRLTSGVWGSGLSLNNAILWSYMADDPDLTKKDEELLKQALGIHDEESKSQGRSNNYGIDLKGYQGYGAGSYSGRPVYGLRDSVFVSTPNPNDPWRKAYNNVKKYQ